MAGMGAGQSQLDYVLKNNNTQISTCIFFCYFLRSLSLSLSFSLFLCVLCGIVGVSLSLCTVWYCWCEKGVYVCVRARMRAYVRACL